MPAFTKAVPIKLSEFGKEAYIQDLLASDPSLLGFGNLYLRGKERAQASSGRLDLLFESEDTSTWYEVEVQLRATDESHIIRTIEYWDIERRNHPSKKHIAVLVAEEITSRFFNVIGLFNQQIPIIAIQMQAYDVGGEKTIVFTTILDQRLQPEIEEEESEYQPANDPYWRERASNTIVDIADEILGYVRVKEPAASFKYNKGYIRISLNGQPSRFMTLRPQKKKLRISLSCEQSSEMDDLLKKVGYDFEYEVLRGKYVFWIYPDDWQGDRDYTRQIVQHAYTMFSMSVADAIQ